VAKKSFGAIVKSGGSGGTTVAELYSVTPPTLKVDTEETTNHGQADIYRQWISTLADWGEMEIEMGMSAATITQFNALIGVDTTSWYISFEFGGTDITFTFTGILVEYSPSDEAPIDGKYKAKAKIKPTGNITFGGLT
jgi:hypothetical protein